MNPTTTPPPAHAPAPKHPSRGPPKGPRVRPRTVLVALLLGSAVLLSLALVPTPAHSGNNHGTIKVHDGEVEDPPRRNVPHVSCEFWVEGFNMAGSSGTIVFYGWPPTGDRSQVGDPIAWTGSLEDDDEGYHFLLGPLELDPGHYKVEAFLDQGHPGNTAHSAKSKVFWVEPCEPPENPCPTDLTAMAHEDGSIEVNWTDAVGSDSTNLYRAVGDGDFEFVDNFDLGVETYLDTDTVAGETYTYEVRGLFGDVESTGDCPDAEATAIPEFPTILASGLAMAAGAIAYAGFRRRDL